MVTSARQHSRLFRPPGPTVMPSNFPMLYYYGFSLLLVVHFKNTFGFIPKTLQVVCAPLLIGSAGPFCFYSSNCLKYRELSSALPHPERRKNRSVDSMICSYSVLLPTMWITLPQRFTPHYLAFLLIVLTSTAAGESPSFYTPVDNILVNCGSSEDSNALDGRSWSGDANPKYLTIEQSQNQASLTASAVKRSPSAPEVPFATARLSLSPFTYSFPVTAGQKFIRLYFNPASYPNFDRSNALFAVKAGHFILLSNFNASLTADADEDTADTISKEYCVNVEQDQRLNITFTPSGSNSYAFINGIEILLMPTNLYYTPSEDPGFSFIGQASGYRIENSTALEMVYRLNVGGKSISPAEDTGMFRQWSDDYQYLRDEKRLAQPSNNTIELTFSSTVPAYTAPKDVYLTARSMGTNSAINLSYNLTWEFPVDSGFTYLIRLHFCEFQPEITDVSQRVFLIFIANETAERAADVILWSGGNGKPTFRDYAVSMLGKETKKKSLFLALGANPDVRKTAFQDAILNGLEIFKLSDSDRNLAGQNPDPLPWTPPTVSPPRQLKKSNNRITIAAVTGGAAAGFVMVSILGFLIFRRGKNTKETGSGDGSTWWGPFSFSTTKSTKTHKSALPSYLCRYFSLVDIKAATNNFDEVSIIGVGGFGNVYKGHIDSGANPVAIKRLAPGSQQGANEFETEIRMLSQLRHQNLVSLIGYCNDGNEMILVYEYMARGTLRDHLYKTENRPLSWKQRLHLCIDAARGLNYLHAGAKHTVIHRDVKTTNILLDEEWVAKVSDFGLSKMGPTNVSKAHVSTVVKGSFGYLDPEYYRRQRLTDKSDVYSFGVVLCEVLCARPPIMRTAEKKQVSLAEWARQSYRSGKLHQIVDPTLKGQIAPGCLKKFGEVAVSCLLDSGVERPSMNDVVWSLEFALQLQESADQAAGFDVAEKETRDAEELALWPKSKSDDSDDLFSRSGGLVSSSDTNSKVMIISSGEQSFSGTSKDSDQLMSSRAVFSEIMNPNGR
ncbi:Receptor-like protein kinase FERONIA [Morella rubra]|uniref:Receptor-like protein kinase FERONIA n=1 Tax=Morella rubra TaxID=262757 RepID=A0A6A1VFB0_9ROSI|nr:Receptor-like protein kinase FERONIA [Morella rubra]